MIDFAPDNRPIGIELLNVHLGVDVRGLPEHEAVTALLLHHGIRVLTPTEVAS